MKPAPTKIPISRRALIQRVNRKLRAVDTLLKTCPETSRYHAELGDYYTVSLRLNSVEDKDVVLDVLARELGALKPYEALRAE